MSLFTSSGSNTSASDAIGSALTGGKRGRRGEGLFGPGRTNSSAYNDALSGFGQTAPGDGSLRFEPSNKTQREIEGVIRDFQLNSDMFGGANAPGITQIGTAFIWMMAVKYPALLCSPLAKKALRAKVGEDGTFFETAMLTKLKGAIANCKANFAVVAIKGVAGSGIDSIEISNDPNEKMTNFALIQTNVTPPTIEYFSPNTDFRGFDRFGDTVGRSLRKKLGAQIRPIPPTICPEISKDAPSYRLRCILWTLYYFSIRITHPDLSTEAIASDVMRGFNRNAGSSREDFLGFIEDLYAYWIKSEKFDGNTWNSKDLAATNSQKSAVIQLGVTKPKELWRAFWKLITSFSLCQCIPTNSAGDKEYCLDLGDAGVVGEEQQILVFRKAMKACTESRLFLLTYGSNGRRSNGALLFDRELNVYYAMAYPAFEELNTGDGKVTAVKPLAADDAQQKFFERAANQSKPPTAITDAEFIPDIAAGEDLSKAKQNATSVWEPVFTGMTANKPTAAQFSALAQTLDVMFLYYLRIKYPQNTLFIIRDFDAKEGQERVRSEFHRELLNIAKTRTVRQRNAKRAEEAWEEYDSDEY